MHQQLYIPDKLKVGFQDRPGTYTGQLAYIVYYDQKGKLRKEASWNSWRDEKIEPLEIDNEPFEGFVLNKKAGGNSSWSWHTRRTVARVWDPRGEKGFEFEISVDNLLFILQECDCNKGKAIEGKFVYAWQGNILVLLPVGSEDYQRSRKFTDIQGDKVGVRELVAGATYLTRKQETWHYLGRFQEHAIVPRRTYGRDWRKDSGGSRPVFVFWDGKNYLCETGVKQLAHRVGEEIHPDYAELVEGYNRSPRGSRVLRLFLQQGPAEIPPEGDSFYQRQPSWFYEKDGQFYECYSSYSHPAAGDGVYLQSILINQSYQLQGTELIVDYLNEAIYSPGYAKKRRERSSSSSYYPLYDKNIRTVGFVEPTGLQLWAELESGATYRVSNASFHTEKE